MVLQIDIPNPEALNKPRVLTRPLKAPYPDEPDAPVLTRPIPKEPDSDATFQPVKDFTDYTKANYQAGIDAQSSPYLSRRLLGTVGAVTAPIGGVAHAMLSKPLERATGQPADTTDLALSFTPAGIGTAAGLAGKAAKAIPGGTKALDAVGGAIKNNSLSQGVQAALSPTTMSKEAGKAEGIVREQRGLAERSTEQAKAKLENDYDYLSRLPEKDQLAFINRVETYGKSTPLADARMEKSAGSMRDIYRTVRNDLETDPNFDKMGFVEDYFPHMWQDPKKAQQFIEGWASKAGSGKATQKRSIPTIEDGIKAGLVPRSTNPAEMTLQYVGNMYNYKALKGVQSAMTEQGLRKFAPRGIPGWVALKGPGNERLYVDKKGIPHKLNAYAPEDAARIYNRYYSPGFTGKTSDAVRTLRGIVNGGTQMVLGLSGYHYRLMANESTAAAFSKGLSRAEAGKPREALKAVAGGTPYAGAIRQLHKGKQVEEQYITGKGALDHKIIDYMTRGGGRMKGIDKSMETSASGNYWKAWKNGTLKAVFMADTMNIKAGGPIKAVGKVMDTVAYPLFVKTIPRIKNAVNYESIADWVKMHPGASDQEILKASRDIIDSTDNRFGEMIQDNIFWDKKLKESVQLMLLSTGWALGTGREIVGGSKDLAKSISEGKELSPRARYIIAAPISNMLHASVYQYLKTGQGPSQPQDLIYPKTGGVSPYDGAPERAPVPGQIKDIIGYAKHPGTELYNKLAPVWKTVGEMATNSDWRGDPIYNNIAKDAPGPLRAYAAYLIGAFSPISVKGALEGPKKGSNIGRAERLIAGTRPAGMEKENPTAYNAMMEKKELAREKAGIRHKALDEQRHQQ